MRHHKEIEYETPKLIPAAELPQKALDFIYGSSVVIESIIHEVEEHSMPLAEAHKIIRHILSDMQSELKEFPKEGHPIESCRYCLPDYNNCHLGVQQCMTNYIHCAETCTQ